MDTATELFLEQGFDAVRASEVAEACGVSEKTVFNYFPTREALTLDRLDHTVAGLRAGLADPGRSLMQAAQLILSRKLDPMISSLTAHDDRVRATARFPRLGHLIRTTPSLQVHQSRMMDSFVAAAAEVLAERAGLSLDDPEPQIAAAALLGLWRVQAQALRTHLDGARTVTTGSRPRCRDFSRACGPATPRLNAIWSRAATRYG